MAALDYSSFHLWTVFGLLLILKASTVESDIFWNRDSVRVVQGEPVLVTCSATNVGMFDAVKIVLRRAGKPSESVTVNADLSLPFQNSGRFGATLEDNDDFVAVRLNISGARGEDSGELVCYTLNNPDKIATQQLTVDVPVLDVYFETQNETTGEMVRLTDSASYTLKEGQNTGVVCVALMDGTDRPATMTMTLDIDDVSHMFERMSSPLVVKPKDRLEVRTNRATMSYLTQFPNKKLNGRKLTCMANSLTGYQKEADVYLNVYYAPVITCKLMEYFAQLEKPVAVVCRVTSNPAASMIYLYETEVNSPTEYTQHPHANQFRIQEETISETEVKLRINIHHVHATHFGKYIIRATNDYGSKNTEFYIHQGALDVDEEPTLLTPTPPKPTTPAPTEKQLLVGKTQPSKQEVKKYDGKDGPREQAVLDPEDPQASMDGAASAVTVSMTMAFVLGFVHIAAISLRR